MRWMGARIVPDRLNRRAAELLSTTVRTPTLIVKVGQKRTIYVSFRKATDSRRHFHCLEETSMTIFLLAIKFSGTRRGMWYVLIMSPGKADDTKPWGTLG
jgi:hypothetical protein